MKGNGEFIYFFQVQFPDKRSNPPEANGINPLQSHYICASANNLDDAVFNAKNYFAKRFWDREYCPSDEHDALLYAYCIFYCSRATEKAKAVQLLEEKLDKPPFTGLLYSLVSLQKGKENFASYFHKNGGY